MPPSAAVAAIVLATSLGACTSVSKSSCAIVNPLPERGEPIPALPDLQLAVSTMMRAHCACDFDEAARSRIPLGIDGRGGWSLDKVQHCLGKLEIRNWSVEGEDLVSIELATAATIGANPRDSLVVFAHLVDGRWLLSWPTGTGPELH